MEPSHPSLRFLLECSDTTLADLELASLNRGARSLKTSKAELQAAIDSFVNAEIARYFREHRKDFIENARKSA